MSEASAPQPGRSDPARPGSADPRCDDRGGGDLGHSRCGRGWHQRELEILHGLIEERQRELRAAAVALGTRFYAEKSSIFCERLGGYWNTWRREKTPWVQSAEATP